MEGKKRTRRTFEEKAAKLRNKLSAATVLDDEAPLSVQEASKFWGQGIDATRRYFKNVAGVRIIKSPLRYIGGRKRRRYITLLIPPSVLKREIENTSVAA